MDPAVILCFIVLFGLLLLTVPIAVSIGVAVLAAIWVGELEPMLFVQKLYASFESYPTMAIPFFLMSGAIMQRGSMAPALIHVSRTLVGHIPGGLVHVSILTCIFYGALCGSAVATLAAVGGLLIPAMKSEGYPADSPQPLMLPAVLWAYSFPRASRSSCTVPRAAFPSATYSSRLHCPASSPALAS